MPYCHNCGAEVHGNQEVCLSCGAILTDKPITTYETNTFGWGLLGFCIPVVGLVLYLVWNKEKPKTAKAAGIGALVSFILSIILYIVYFVILIKFFGDIEPSNYYNY